MRAGMRTIFLVLAAFLLTWIPMLVLALLEMIGRLGGLAGGWTPPPWFRVFSMWSMCAGSVTYPILYGIYNRAIRKELRLCLSCSPKTWRRRNSHFYSSQSGGGAHQQRRGSKWSTYSGNYPNGPPSFFFLFYYYSLIRLIPMQSMRRWSRGSRRLRLQRRQQRPWRWRQQQPAVRLRRNWPTRWPLWVSWPDPAHQESPAKIPVSWSKSVLGGMLDTRLTGMALVIQTAPPSV